MFGPEIAKQLRQRGVDTVAALELGHISIPDEVHLAYAGETRRCLVTQDYHDFLQQTVKFSVQGRPHAGLVLVPKSISTKQYGPLVRGLGRLAAAHPEGLTPYTILWLSIPDVE